MNYECKQCGEVCIERCGMVICEECGYEVPKDTADKENLLEACKEANEHISLIGTTTKDMLEAAIALAEKID